MNYNLNEIYVNKHDPYFTADKWNDSLAYSQNFEKMLNKFFGGTFKGLYKPFLSYDIYDYVWFNNDYYQVVDTNNTDTEFFNKSNYKDVVYYKNNQFIGLNEKNQIVLFDKSNVNVISSNTFQKIYLHENDIIGLNNQKLYKIDVVNKTTNLINYIFARTINDIKRDKFQIYIVTNNVIEVGNTLNNDMTETKKLYETNRRIVDTALNDTHILVLLDNNNVDIINKSTGKKDGYFTISQSINLQKVKTVCIDDYSYLVYDGNNKILTFNKTGNIYNYYSFISNPNFVGTTSLTSNNNYIVTTNPTTITKLIATRYSLSVVDIKSIIIKDLVSKKSNVIAEYIDFSKGQYETDTLKPVVSTIKAYNNKGVAIKNSLSYNYNLTNKTIMFRLEANSNVNGNVLSIKIGNKNISIQASNITGEHYYAVILLSDKYKVAHYHNDIKDVTIHNYPIMSSSENKFTFSSSTEYILKNFIIFKNSVEAESLIDFYYRNDLSSFDIQASTKSYPYSYVKTDENGNINLNIQDKSILKASNGFKVNMSSNTSLKDRDIALNMEGANRLKSEIDKETLELANTKLDKSNVSVDYNTAKKIEDKIKENKSYSDKELQKVNSNLQSSIETTKNNLTNSINTKLNKGNVSSEYDSAKKIEDKIKSNRTYSDNEIKKVSTNTEKSISSLRSNLTSSINTKLDKGSVQTKYNTAEKIGNEIDKKINRGSLPSKITDAKTIYDLIENNSGLNFDSNLLYLNDSGTKYVNKIYFDRNKKGMFKCVSQTTSTVNSTSYFVDISNEANSSQLRNLITIYTQYENLNGTNSIITLKENMDNYREIIFVFTYNGGVKMTQQMPISQFKIYSFGYDMRGGENADRNYGAQILYKSSKTIQATGRLRIFKVMFTK